MSHVDEGRLEAWIDRDRSGMSAVDAAAIAHHLESCAACSSLLAESLRLRERAGSILGGMQLNDSRTPDFERVRARASGVAIDAKAPPRQTRRPLVAFAWAASLVAAIGIGWMTRDLLSPGGDLVSPVQVTYQDGSGRAQEVAVLAPEVGGSENANAPSEPAITPPPPVGSRAPLPTGNEATGRGPEVPGGASGASGSVVTSGPTPPATTPTSPSAQVASSAESSASAPFPSTAATPLPPIAEVARSEAEVVVERARAATVAGADAVSGDGRAGVVAQGRVVTPSGDPVPGASVLVGPSRGTLTDADGRFSLLVPEEQLAGGAGVPLTVSRLGYSSQTLSLADIGRDTITAHIELAQTVLALQSVVAAAYGESRASGAVSAQPFNASAASPAVEASEAANAARAVAPSALRQFAAGVSVTMSEAQRQLGSPLVSVPGLQILSVELVGNAGAPIVQIRQRLPEGGTLLLIERVEPWLATILEDAPGVSTAQVRRGSLYVTGVAPITPDALQRLLDAAQ